MSKTDLDKAEIEQLWRMIAIPDLMRNGFLAVGQELIKRDAEISRLTAEKDAAIAQNYCKTCGNTLDGYVPKSEPEPGEFTASKRNYIIAHMRKEEHRTSTNCQDEEMDMFVKWLDESFDKIDHLEAENKKLQDRPDYSDLDAAVFINSVLEVKLKAKDEELIGIKNALRARGLVTLLKEIERTAKSLGVD